MISLSEHDDAEDQLGRLSMWRAYGSRNGVALVLNPGIFTTETDELKAYSGPVIYQSADEFGIAFGAWVTGIVEKEEELAAVDDAVLHHWFFYAFRLFVLCTKHPGFHEEREWRVFHSPLVDGSSPWLRKENEVLQGVPQEIVKLSLRNDPAKNVVGLDPAGLINRVLIGPSQHPVPTYHALHNALVSADIEDPGERLWITNIPIRQ